MQLNVGVLQEFVSQISRSLALLEDCAAFLGLRKRVIHQEPQHHTRIILNFVKIFRFFVESVQSKHYQQKEDSYIGVDCVHVSLLSSALISTTKF